MHSSTSTGRDRFADDGGFTLVEVMVVIVIIGVLLAAGVPTYRGARTRAQDTAAETSLYYGMVAATIVFVDELDFTDANGAGMTASEPGLAYVDSPSPSTGDEQLSVAAGGSTWGAAVLSASGTCFYVRTDGISRPIYGSSDSEACTGTVALTIPG